MKLCRVLLLCLISTAVRAQDSAAAAEQVMAQGQQLFEKGDYAGAITVFHAALTRHVRSRPIVPDPIYGWG